MNDSDCVAFLQWALPRIRMRWPGFRKVRGQVCKRIARRMRELDLSVEGYRSYLEHHTGEWRQLDRCCRITISRFYRDKGVFEFLKRVVLPDLARHVVKRGERSLRMWSVGCGSGEEAYSLALLWAHCVRAGSVSVETDILGSDVDATLLQRAQTACYPLSALRELPRGWIQSEFAIDNGCYCLRPSHKDRVRFVEHDVRSASLGESFDLILCRNLVFTYFDTALQHETLEHLVGCLRHRGALVIGMHEDLPADGVSLVAWSAQHHVYRRPQIVDNEVDVQSGQVIP